jgi:hypothetical protein
MMLQALFSWWYGPGWVGLSRRVGQRIDGALAFFSVGLLARTLFDPFRQIDAGKVRGPVGLQLRAWVDRSFSRIVGFFVRSTMILFGLVVAAMLGVAGILQLVLWPVMPFLPIVGLLLMIVGWTP